MRQVGKSRRTAAAVAVAVAAVLIGSAPAPGVAQEQSISGLKGPRGLDFGPGGRLIVSQANGAYGSVERGGEGRGTFHRLGKVPRSFVAPALDMNRRRELFVLAAAGPAKQGLSTLYRWTRADGQEKVANIVRYQRTDPDPFNLAQSPSESNPYGVAALDDGSALVADAANNDLLRVRPNGKIYTVARVRPRTVEVPDGLGDNAPPAGTLMRAEAVITSVTVGSDGYYYIGELRGFPATPGTSAVWRVAPNAHGAVCNPKRPDKGACRMYADGFTSIVGLAAGRGRALYVAELSKKSWLAIEDPNAPRSAFVGSVIRVGRDTDKRRDLKSGKIRLPGDVAVSRRGAVMVTTPIFGDGVVRRVR